jgi:hypothetical protein
MALRQGAGSLLQRLAAAPLEGALASQTAELLGWVPGRGARGV